MQGTVRPQPGTTMTTPPPLSANSRSSGSDGFAARRPPSSRPREPCVRRCRRTERVVDERADEGRLERGIELVAPRRTHDEQVVDVAARYSSGSSTPASALAPTLVPVVEATKLDEQASSPQLVEATADRTRRASVGTARP